MKNDTDRIVRYLDILSEQNIERFENVIMINGSFEDYDAIFDIYRDFKKSSFGNFDDKNLQDKLEKFNESFEKLDIFLSEPHKWTLEKDYGWYPRRKRLENTTIVKNDEIKTLLDKFDSDYQVLTGAFRAYFKNEEKIVPEANNAKLISKKRDNPFLKFPHKIPRGTKWENFFIKFLDDEKVTIDVVGKKHETSFKEMGFEDKRNGRPDSQWKILLFVAKHNGEIIWKTQDVEDRFKIKKWAERLANKLQEYFGIDYDPFNPYKENRSYRIKLTLIPPQDTKENDPVQKQSLSDETEDMFRDLSTGHLDYTDSAN